MRLYKYVGMGALKAILRTSTLGFSKPHLLNDPFDGPNSPDVPDYGVFGSITAQIKNLAWSDNTAICSLTRTMKNALMWAHYGDSHKGAAIEIDAAACGFFDPATNLVPAHLGSVVYVQEPDMDQYVTRPSRATTVGRETEFRLDRYEMLQRMFLTKPLCWAYEEEVRVVKGIHDLSKAGESLSGRFEVVQAGGRDLHALHIPAQAIKGVYLGIRAEPAEIRSIRDLVPAERLFQCFRQRGSFDIGSKPLPPPSPKSRYRITIKAAD